MKREVINYVRMDLSRLYGFAHAKNDYNKLKCVEIMTVSSIIIIDYIITNTIVGTLNFTVNTMTYLL